ncbi:hypothetical protein BH09MYX1_BH09MYX1_07520 [soil metagenome]
MKSKRIASAAVVASIAVVALAIGCTTEAAPEKITSSSSGLAITGLFATGVDNANVPLLPLAQDPHYALIVSPDPTFQGPATFVLDPLAYPIVAGPWAANSLTSQWISIRPGGTGVGANGNYTYRTTFNLANVDPSAATLSGTWGCDDDCTLVLNGTVVATRANAYAALAAFNVGPGSSFVLGTNDLDIVVANSGGGPTGVRIDTISGTAVCTQDSQCGSGNFCNEITANPAVCAPKLANGQTVTGGTCTNVIGARTCISAVCDPSDQKCGFVNGTGPCTTLDQGTVCRSGSCSANGGVCIPTGGCAKDADCNTATQWCNVSTFTCTNKVPNGTSVPTDPGHVNPTLNGTCGAQAATVTCVSGVCDNGDDKCGFADGTGPCTTQNGTTVCRSGLCGLGLVCIPQGGCSVDADCKAGWCSISTKTCQTKITNGNPVPIDPGHVTPTLDGKCGGPAATLTCVSGVCDPKDDKCGLLSGTGPCTPQTGATVCRSGLCGASNVCIDAGTCAVDADCPGQWCNVSAKKCAPKVPNSSPVPSDPGHVTPKVDGKCTTDSGKLTCVTAVCDADNLCGLKNGTPCDPKAPTQCRSAICDGDGKCGKPDGESCTTPNDCRSANCTSNVCGGVVKPDAGTDSGADGGASTPGDGVLLEGGGVGCSASGSSKGNWLALLGATAGLVMMRRKKKHA